MVDLATVPGVLGFAGPRVLATVLELSILRAIVPIEQAFLEEYPGKVSVLGEQRGGLRGLQGSNLARRLATSSLALTGALRVEGPARRGFSDNSAAPTETLEGVSV